MSDLHSNIQMLFIRAEWMDDAECKGIPSRVHHPTNPDGRTLRRHQHDMYDQARDICNGCPVKIDCLVHALRSDEREGMWGGLLPHERRDIHVRLKDSGLGFALNRCRTWPTE